MQNFTNRLYGTLNQIDTMLENEHLSGEAAETLTTLADAISGALEKLDNPKGPTDA